jgi:hypothetical protein
MSDVVLKGYKAKLGNALKTHKKSLEKCEKVVTEHETLLTEVEAEMQVRAKEKK